MTDFERFPLLRTVKHHEAKGEYTKLYGTKGRTWHIAPSTVYQERLHREDQETEALAALERALGHGSTLDAHTQFVGFRQWFPAEPQDTTIHGVELKADELGRRVELDYAPGLSDIVTKAASNGAPFDLVLQQAEGLMGGDAVWPTAVGPVRIVTAPALPEGMLVTLRTGWLHLFSLGSPVSPMDDFMAVYSNLLISAPELCTVFAINQ